MIASPNTLSLRMPILCPECHIHLYVGSARNRTSITHPPTIVNGRTPPEAQCSRVGSIDIVQTAEIVGKDDGLAFLQVPEYVCKECLYRFDVSFDTLRVIWSHMSDDKRYDAVICPKRITLPIAQFIVFI